MLNRSTASRMIPIDSPNEIYRLTRRGLYSKHILIVRLMIEPFVDILDRLIDCSGETQTVYWICQLYRPGLISSRFAVDHW